MSQGERKSISIVAGARPNFMKIAPIMRALEASGPEFAPHIVHTGQHYDEIMSDIFFSELGIPKPAFHLGAGGGTHAEQTALIMTKYEQYLASEDPDLVLVVGDVNSTLACSIVAKKGGKKVAHVEAGLRSNDLFMPEEINRIVTDSLSDYFFVTERTGVENLEREGKPKDAIHFVGHVMIDNLFYEVEKLSATPPDPVVEEIKSKCSRYGVVTLHRPSNVDDEPVLSGIIDALNSLSSELPLVFPVHPRTRAKISEFGLDTAENFVLTEPMGYRSFLSLWKDSAIVLTDSGGLQEETTALSVPCLTLRHNTERPATVSDGSNQVIGTAPKAILNAAQAIIGGPQQQYGVPELWDGHAATRIVDVLTELVGENAF